MNKPKTTLEKRAAAACASIQEAGSGAIEVYWNKSRTWGNCPVIYWCGEKAAYASGCGYDKLSSVLADFLRWLAPDTVLRSGGAGVRSVIEELAALGWELVQTYDGRDEDGFEIKRK